jgi:hypothetical protein
VILIIAGVVILPIILKPLHSTVKQIYSQREYSLITKLRYLLKDLPDDAYRSLNTLVEEQRGERWSDQQLYMYLIQAVSDVNTEPPFTTYDINNFPAAWEATILNGGMILNGGNSPHQLRKQSAPSPGHALPTSCEFLQNGQGFAQLRGVGCTEASLSSPHA